MNITLSLDDTLVEAGRNYAHEHGTSLNALIRQLLTDRVNPENDQALEDFIEVARTCGGDSGGWKWNREDLYEA